MAVHTRSRSTPGMGLLDKLQPKKPQPKPSDLAFDSEGNLLVRWDDGRESKFPPRWLRANCPCAGCVEEWRGRRHGGRGAGEGRREAAGHERGGALRDAGRMVRWSLHRHLLLGLPAQVAR